MNLNSRPPYEKRTFNSLEIDNYIQSLEKKFNNPNLYKIFSNCYPNTLDTTIDYCNYQSYIMIKIFLFLNIVETKFII